MIDLYINSSVYVQVILAGCFSWFISTLGAGIVFFFKKVNKNILDGMLGLSAGVMISASFFSLLNPAINQAEELKMISWIVVSLGFVSGSLLLIGGDKLFNKYFNKNIKNKTKNIKRTVMLFSSITLHNIPEGLAIGVAFGSIMYGIEGATLSGALMLTLGIAIQNFPEGTAVSLPLRRENYSRLKSFIYGSLSAVVEPIAALIGCILVMYVKNVMPFLLSFAAGAMIYVAISELIPESQENKNKNLMSLFTIIGFVFMMILDVALG